MPAAAPLFFVFKFSEVIILVFKFSEVIILVFKLSEIFVFIPSSTSPAGSASSLKPIC